MIFVTVGIPDAHMTVARFKDSELRFTGFFDVVYSGILTGTFM